MSVEKMKILDYLMIAHGKERDQRLFSHNQSPYCHKEYYLHSLSRLFFMVAIAISYGK